MIRTLLLLLLLLVPLVQASESSTLFPVEKKEIIDFHAHVAGMAVGAAG